MEGEGEGIEAVDGLGDTEAARLAQVFLHKGAKQPIPDDEHPGEVAVYVFGVAGVVHPVVGGGVEDPLQPAQLAHHLGVDEELKAQAQEHCGDHGLGGEADEDHGDPEQPHAGDGVHQALAKGGGEVEPLRAVVHHVGGPEPAHVVARKVEQPVAEILQQEEQQEAPEVQLYVEQSPAPKTLIEVGDGDGRQGIAPLVHQGQGGVGEQVPPLVGGGGKGCPVFAQIEHLPADEGQKEGGEVEQQQLHIHVRHPVGPVGFQHTEWI
ncbi:hypothetical protein D3C80_873160 [compost metagenome]